MVSRVGSGAGTVPVLLLAIAAMTAGCYPPQLLTMRSGLDSLRVVVDTLVVRDAIAYQVLMDTRREIADQRDVLLSTRATTGTTTKQLFDQMGRLEARLEEVGGRFQQWNQRNPASAPAAPGADPNALYDQAALDLTQGRYSMALEGFREFVRRFPAAELADNAQYGIGECFFAQARFDSAAVEYARVESSWPQGDKIPAALYKLALCQEKLQQGSVAKKTLEDLVKRFPLSGEAQLARERLGSGRR
ncbi:MAG: tol-pal system protein YbgF [Candidatus Eisenbacteria bacterium]